MEGWEGNKMEMKEDGEAGGGGMREVTGDTSRGRKKVAILKLAFEISKKNLGKKKGFTKELRMMKMMVMTKKPSIITE